MEPVWYDVERADEGVAASLLPAVRLWCPPVVNGVRPGVTVVQLTEDEVPVDTKFFARLPYRPHTPPWEPAAVERAVAEEARNATRAAAADARRCLATLEALRSNSAPSIDLDLDAAGLRLEVAARDDEAARAHALVARLNEGRPVQAPNTTLLGFRPVRRCGCAAHCDGLVCRRSPFY